MKLSTRGRYGTRALLDLALHRQEEPVSLKDIASRQQISLAYLEHLITPLIAPKAFTKMLPLKSLLVKHLAWQISDRP